MQDAPKIHPIRVIDSSIEIPGANLLERNLPVGEVLAIRLASPEFLDLGEVEELEAAFLRVDPELVFIIRSCAHQMP